MFIIAIPQEQRSLLKSNGVAVKVNGRETTVRSDGEYLTYLDDGQLHRCKILDEVFDEELVRFVAASHGAEGDTVYISNAARIEFNGIAGENPEELRRAVEQAIKPVTDRLGCKYDMDCLAANLGDVRDAVEAGRIPEPETFDALVQAITAEYRAHVAAAFTFWRSQE